ncbi:uncharacterized protein N7459_002665 [Penicillium hispanicum]|uniref:uncharacterized protein n=1 Tax=Penicillium hispanicum TaxID=1080232 RepID=UPI002540119B|nr:uncharacterized protein N7459_002665 [Penicillium hispanicum]KAJ5586900.1 hypothetical protein N7459_002665 [Penicillium hispanicum]
MSDDTVQARRTRREGSLSSDLNPSTPGAAEHIDGVFSQTLLPSPVIQWILPACLRSKSHNDVVFIGQRRVQIKEAVPRGYLEDIAEKENFYGDIVAAKALNVSTGIPWNLEARDSYHGPSHLLILCVGMKELLFMCSPGNRGDFISKRRPLPVDVSLGDRFGKHLAVDPKSRAVAVSASNDYFGLMRLRPVQDIQAQIIRHELDPLKQERFYKLIGTIMFMEFLHPKTADDKSIILLLITHRDGLTQAVTYTWNEDDDIAETEPKMWRIKLRPQDQLPTMIVPLTKESSFLLTTTTSMAVYPSSGSRVRPSRYPLIAPDSEISEASLWTRWARPARNWLYSQSRDGIYLCREDGWIYLLEFGNESVLESTTCLGQLHCDVDTAFDLLHMGYEGGDFIIAAGSTGDGGLFIQEARGQPQCVQRFINWAPTTDAAIVNSRSENPAQGSLIRNRLFTCSRSSSDKGEINELRFGIEAQIGVTVPLDDFSSIRDMWAMHDHVTRTIYVLMSDPVTSLLLSMNSDLEEGITALNEEETELDHAQTLAAGYSPEGVMIQVSKKATHLFAARNPSLNTHFLHDSQTTVLAVTVDGPTSAIITAVRHGGELYLCYSQVVIIDDNISLNVGQRVKLDKEPICLFLQTFGLVTFVFMGSIEGTIIVYQVEDQNVSFLFEDRVDVSVNDDMSRVVESLTTVCNTPNAGDDSLRAFLLCGLRGGTLVSFEIDFNASSLIGLRQEETTVVGTTSVRLQGKETSALLTCGNELWRVSYAWDLPSPAYTLRRVWITDQNNLAWFPTFLHGFELISLENTEPGSPSGPLFCFADQQLLICNLNTNTKMVPRRISLPGQPTKLIYSDQLQRLIVSYTITRPESLEFPWTHTTKSYLEFVHPDSQHPVAHQSQVDMRSGVQPWRPESDDGEIITCILDWSFNRNGQLYHLIVLGTSLPAVGPEKLATGRLILLRVGPASSDTSRIECTTRHVEELPDPVRAIAGCGDCLLVGTGSWIIPFTPRNATMRWSSRAPYLCPSTVIAITVHERFILVSTSRHSWLLLEILTEAKYREEWGVVSAPLQPTPEQDNQGALMMNPAAWSQVDCDGLAQTVDRLGYRQNSLVAFMSGRGGSVSVARFDQLPHEDPRYPEIRLPDSIIRLASDPARKGGLYGFALNGSVYRFYIPAEKEMPLLQFLQSMCYKNETICPSCPRSLRRLNPLTLEGGCHINGDIIARLARRGPQFLQYLLVNLNDSKSYNLIQHRYRQLAIRAIGSSTVDDVIGWLRVLVDPVI